MAITVLQLAAKVSADTKEAEDGLKRVREAGDSASGSKDGGGVSGLIKSMVGIAGGVLGATAVTGALGFLKDQFGSTIKAATDYQQTQAQTNAVLLSTKDASGQSAEGIQKLAESLQQVTPFSKDATQQAENMLLTFTNIHQNLPQVTQTTLDFATAMHMDATSAALQLGKALNDPATGYSKLQREGVTFTKSQIETMKQMEASGNMAGAQAVMLQELQKEFGGSAKAAGGTFAGALTIAQNQLTDTKEKIGNALIPVLAKLLTGITPLITSLTDGLGVVLPIVAGLFGDLMTAVQPLLDNLPSLATTIGTQLTGAGQKVLPILKQLQTIFQQNLMPIFRQVWQIIQQDVLPIMRQLGQLFISQIVPAIGSTAQWFEQHMMPALKKVADFVKATVMPIVKTLVTVLTTDVLPAVEHVGAIITDKLLPPLEKIMSKILPILNPLLQLAGWLFKNLIGPAIGDVVNILAGLATGISDVIGWIGNLMGWLGNAKDKFGDFLGKIGDVKDMLNGALTTAINGIGSAFGTVFGGLWAVVKAPINLIIGGINDLIGGLDSIKIKVPGWVPGVGGKEWGINIPKIPQLATGGTAQTAGDVIVGERGPELLHMPQGASVIPLGGAGLNGAGGVGGGAPQYVQVNTTITLDGYRVAQVVSQHMPAAVRTATGARGF